MLGGRLSDAQTSEGLAGVVVIRELHQSIASGADGRFGFPVAPGSYTVDVIINRDITYQCPVTNPIVVTANTTATLNLSCTN